MAVGRIKRDVQGIYKCSVLVFHLPSRSKIDFKEKIRKIYKSSDSQERVTAIQDDNKTRNTDYTDHTYVHLTNV